MKTKESKVGMRGRRPSRCSRQCPQSKISDSRSCRSGPRRVSRCATDDVRNLPEVFPVAEAGRTVTAVRGSRGCAVIDTDYGPKVDEIRRATADCLEQSPTWLTILSGSSNTPTAIRCCRTWSNCDRTRTAESACLKTSVFPLWNRGFSGTTDRMGRP